MGTTSMATDARSVFEAILSEPELKVAAVRVEKLR